MGICQSPWKVVRLYLVSIPRSFTGTCKIAREIQNKDSGSITYGCVRKGESESELTDLTLDPEQCLTPTLRGVRGI